MVSCSNIMVVMILVVVCNRVNCCSGKDSRCGRHGPKIRFPFHFKDSETEDGCGYKGFGLTCSDTHKTLLELPSHSGPIVLQVKTINYQDQYIFVSDPGNCLPGKLLKLHQSQMSTFQLYNLLHSGFDPILCTRTPDIISSLRRSEDEDCDDCYGLTWSKPNCSMCEIQGKMCKLKNNGTGDEIECFERQHKPIKKILLYVTVAIVGAIMVVLILKTYLRLYNYFKTKGEDEARIEKFLEDYRALNLTRFSFVDIKRITNNFREELGEGAHGAVFKGKLSNEILVAVKMLKNTVDDGKEFINEVKAMGKIHHINVVRLIGFCADGCYRALVYNFFSNGSLQNFITQPKNINRFFGWEMLQQIALGIAKGIEYLHTSCDQRILHFDINPHNVLLDDKLVPKITDFGLAKLCSKTQSVVLVTAARGTLGYIAPEVFSRNFGNVSYKADIYSYGMLLLEMIGERKSISELSEENFKVLYLEWVHEFLEGRDMQLKIGKVGDDVILKKLAIVGLWCIQWNPINRPSIKGVLKMLEAQEEGNLIVPPNPFNSTIFKNSEIPKKYSILELESIHE
ncbi:hypothetical protein KIW84_061089 [Lathyrus oleraceus]|uniref:Protein kinase domain-containing protein n=1 Tax=Pisum sativum TaxID=3888 RepID=A0A9D4W347_PEA|nr:hypothetical protein KIW84_061089 [Pisum sativum]